MKPDQFSTDYYKNLAILRKGGYSVKEANKLASKITQKLRKEEKKVYRDEIESQVEDLLDD